MSEQKEIRVRVSAQEHRDINVAAALLGYSSTADFIRSLVLPAAEQHIKLYKAGIQIEPPVR